MLNLQDEYAKLLKELAALEKEMLHYNLWLYENPELPRQEYRAAEEMSSWLEKHGFKVVKGVAELPTAFVATYQNGSGGGEVGFLAEYDALPVVGHGCGHNIIATSSAGAAIAVARWLERTNTAGKVIVFGCPDEEYDGGKVPMIESGIFTPGLSAALHIHPGMVNRLWGWTPSATSMLMKFHGKAAHSAYEPEEGINALHALLIAFRALDALRHHVKDGTRMPATITDGGGAPNAVPAYAEARIHLTAVEKEHLLEVIEKVKNCGRGGALAAGAEVEFWEGPIYDHMLLNKVLGDRMNSHFMRTGMKTLPPEAGTASTDVGNVSVTVPTCAATIKIADPDIKMHSKEFAMATISQRGEKALKDAAAIMALTAMDVIVDELLREQVRVEFLAAVS